MERLKPQSIEPSRVKQWQEIVDNVHYYEKVATEEELEVLRQVDDSTSEVGRFYGVETSPAVHAVHLIDKTKWPEGHAFFSREHGVFVCEK